MIELIVCCFESLHKAEQVRASLLTSDLEFENAVIAKRQRDGLLMWSHWAKSGLSELNVSLENPGGSGNENQIPGKILQCLAGMAASTEDPAGINELLAATLREGLATMDIHDDFLQEITDRLKPERSALFIITRPDQSTEYVERLKSEGGEILQKSLSYDQARFDSVQKERFNAWSNRQMAQGLADLGLQTQKTDHPVDAAAGKSSSTSNAFRVGGILLLLAVVGIAFNVLLVGFCHCGAAHVAHQMCWLKILGMVVLGGVNGWIVNRWILKTQQYFPLVCAAGALFAELTWEMSAAYAVR